VNCPACRAALAPGQERCPHCGALASLRTEGALAPDPALFTRSRPDDAPRKAGKKDASWKDEVRERMKHRRKQRSAPAPALPLFEEPKPLVAVIPEPALPQPPEPAPPAPPDPYALTEKMMDLTEDERQRLDAAVAVDLPLRLDVVPEPPGEAESPEPAMEHPYELGATDEPGRIDEIASGVAEPELRLDAPALPERAPLASVAEPTARDAEAQAESGENDWPLDLPPRAQEPRAVERPARAGERVQAAVLDLVLLGGVWVGVLYFAARLARVSMLGLLPAWPYIGGFLAFLGLGYATFFTGTTGQTLGKLAVGLRVLDISGRPPGYVRALLRTVLGTLGIALTFAGLLPILFDPARRAAHDRLLKTRVVKG
jgi:uncharacterized RDD family membrane protein YckC